MSQETKVYEITNAVRLKNVNYLELFKEKARRDLGILIVNRVLELNSAAEVKITEETITQKLPFGEVRYTIRGIVGSKDR